VPTYFVSVSVIRPPSLGDPALLRLFLEAAERAMCVPGEITAAGLIIEAQPVSLPIFETALRELLGEQSAELESVTIRQI